MIDNSQAQLIFEIFHERIIQAKVAKNVFSNDVFILEGLVPALAVIMAMWFFLLLAIVRVHLQELNYLHRQSVLEIVMFGVMVLLYCISLGLDKQ